MWGGCCARLPSLAPAATCAGNKSCIEPRHAGHCHVPRRLQRAANPPQQAHAPAPAAVQFIGVTIRHYEEVCRQVLLDRDAMATLRRLNVTLTLADITWTCSNPVARALPRPRLASPVAVAPRVCSDARPPAPVGSAMPPFALVPAAHASMPARSACRGAARAAGGGVPHRGPRPLLAPAARLPLLGGCAPLHCLGHGATAGESGPLCGCARCTGRHAPPAGTLPSRPCICQQTLLPHGHAPALRYMECSTNTLRSRSVSASSTPWCPRLLSP